MDSFDTVIVDRQSLEQDSDTTAESRKELRLLVRDQKRLIAATLILALCMASGVLYFRFVENMTIISAIYLTVQTSTTVGFGDIRLQYTLSYAFMSLYCIISTIILTYGIGQTHRYYRSHGECRNAERREFLRQQFEFLKFDEEKGISRAEFTLAVLCHLELVDSNEIDYWSDVCGQRFILLVLLSSNVLLIFTLK